MVYILAKVIHLYIETKQKHDSDAINAIVITIDCFSKTMTFQSDYRYAHYGSALKCLFQ